MVQRKNQKENQNISQKQMKTGKNTKTYGMLQNNSERKVIAINAYIIRQ